MRIEKVSNLLKICSGGQTMKTKQRTKQTRTEFSLDPDHAGTLISNFQIPELWEINLLFISHPIYVNLSESPELNKTDALYTEICVLLVLANGLWKINTNKNVSIIFSILWNHNNKYMNFMTEITHSNY